MDGCLMTDMHRLKGLRAYLAGPIDNAADISIEENEYCGGFEVSFSKYIDLSDHIDLDWLRSEVGVNDEADVIIALRGLCENSGFECRIHGIDEKKTPKIQQ